MSWWWSLLLLTHLAGLALAVGSATVKLVLLLECNADHAFVPTYLRVARPITRQIVVGLVLLVLSGIGWLLLGYGLTPVLVVKLVLVAAVFVIGPVIDNVVEPRFRQLAPAPGQSASPAFIRVQKQHLALEIAATALLYAIVIVWVMART